MDCVQFMKKMRQDHNMTDCTGTLYTTNEVELSRLLQHDTEYDEDQIGKRHD